MSTSREELLVGRSYLDAATALLQRVRSDHPTAGLYEAADLQWWWRVPRSTDAIPQLFWFDAGGRPEAAVISTDWRGRIGLDPMVMPDASLDWVAHVVARGLTHAARSGLGAVQIEVDQADDAVQEVLIGHDFAIEDDGLVESWLAADARPDVSPLPEGYRTSRRADEGTRPHHMIERNGPEVETRLRQTSLYRPDLDLVVYDHDDHVAAYGLFWFDPASATGLVEPMRTVNDHQRRGLARHVLTTGIGLLADAGAERIKICFEPDNPGARHLYLGVGFEPFRQTVVFARRSDVRAS